VNGEEEQQSWIEPWARRVETLGLAPVALPLLEMAEAFGFLGSQVLLLIQPLMSGFVSNTAFERTVALLDSPELLDQFRVCLEGEGS
jgi:hypothetical protein